MVAVVRRELSFWRRLFGVVECVALPAEWLLAEYRSSDIVVLAGRRRETARAALSEDGSEDELLGDFFSDYVNDAVYVTQEEEEEQKRRANNSRQHAQHRSTPQH